MSDLSLQLQQAASQLPVSTYFDETLHQRERALLFAAGPRYLGHGLNAPEPGDYYVLPQEKGGRALVRSPDGRLQLISNCCRHRQALMLSGQGNLKAEGKGHVGGKIVCPIHRWTYDSAGQLLGAPHFASNPGLNLQTWPLREWNGLIFENNGRDVAADLASMGVARDLSFEGYVFDRAEVHECNYNWKTFIEIYLEDYHVEPFHPGLGNFVTVDDLHWQFDREYSVQTVGVAPTFGRPGTDAYRLWHEVLLRYRGGEKRERGAIWLTYYPHIMVEWYPHVLTISTVHPVGPQKTLNLVEFYYPEEIHAFEREFIEAQQAAYMETAIEDDEIGEREDQGRRALLERGVNEVGPYQSPLEDGMRHVHEWYRARMGEALQGH